MSLSSISSLERQAMRYQADVERFATPALSKQRVVVNADKEQEQATLAVCAKIERAIGRRLSLQDAVFTKKPKSQSGLSPPLAKESQIKEKTSK